MKYIFALLAFANPAFASPAFANPDTVHDTATRLFDRLPVVEVSPDLETECGAGDHTNRNIAYCTSRNTIFVCENFASRPQAAYEMAHVLGHAIQVRHGVADVALREISRRRDEETELRGMVTRQVECVAGVLMAQAGLPLADLAALFGEEPFRDAHWGRDPLDNGPRVSIGLDARVAWYRTGYDTRDFAVCSVGEMSSDLIVQALR